VKSFEKADTRSVLIGPGPGSTFPETFQLPPVSPEFCTGGLEKVATVSSKVKSPWKPTKFKPGSMVVVVTGSGITVEMGTDVSKVAVGRDTVTAIGVAVGCAGAAEATPLISREAVAASASPANAFRPNRADECDRFFAKVEKTGVDELCILDSPHGGFRYA